jgi:hypothetical protein
MFDLFHNPRNIHFSAQGSSFVLLFLWMCIYTVQPKILGGNVRMDGRWTNEAKVCSGILKFKVLEGILLIR